jgi:hypothetical protein
MLLSVAVVLVVGEGVARLVSHFDESPPPASLPPKWQALPTLKGIDALTRPNVRGIFTGTLYETNRAGLRGPWRPRRKPSGVFRVVLIGDSFSMGSGVLYQDSYAALLDRMLEEKRHGQRYQVINVAMAGLATVGVMNRFENVGLRYDPDLVIYGYTINDIEGPDYRHTAEPELRDPHRFRDSRSHLIRAVGPRWFSLIELVAAPPGTYTYELDDNYFRTRPRFRSCWTGWIGSLRRWSSAEPAGWFSFTRSSGRSTCCIRIAAITRS